ncbi:MAG: ABC transporter permease, partial [Bryobacteraceae bacterium]
ESEERTVSIPKFMAWKKSRAFQSMAAYDPGAVELTLGAGDRRDPLNALHVTAGFFDVFGVQPVLGRTFSAQEDLPNAGKFAVLTYNFWKNRLAADPAIPGKTILLNSAPYVVTGVLPEWYQADPPADLYLPQQFDPNSTNQGNIYYVAGRLAPGASMESALAELTVIADQFRAEHSDITDKSETVAVLPLRVAIGGEVQLALLVLAGAVCFVLLMACANVANLLLARAAGRQREIAIRTALGATRGQIVRQLLTESMMLAVAGGVAGLALGAAGIRMLLAFSPGNIPRVNDPEHSFATLSLIDWRVLAFLFAISLFTGLLFGLLPAIRVSRLDVNSALKESSSRSGTGLKHNRIRSLLVVGEVAFAIILLTGAALMIRTFAGLRSAKSGMDPVNVLTMQTALGGARYETTAQVENTIRLATQQIESLPGVEFAAAAIAVPMQGPSFDLIFVIEGRAPANGRYEGDEQWRYVSPHYFEAFHIPLLRGRTFDRRDTGKSGHVVIINEEFAKKYWPTTDALGQRMTIGAGIGPEFAEGPREIVGIVGSVTESGLSSGMVPAMYIPQGQVTDGLTKLSNSLLPLGWMIRTKTDPMASASSIRHEFEVLDAQLAPSKILTMEAVIKDSTTRENFNMLMLSVFAAVALLLAAVGIYGLMSYAVEQRTQEIGIRMALGAGRAEMMKMILGQGMRLVIVGNVIGLAAAFGLTRLLAGLLFGVKAGDPLTFAAVTVTLTAVALLAAFVPAQRATRIDPILALRQE